MAAASRMTEKRADALYEILEGHITAIGTGKTGKTKWAAASDHLPTRSLDWLLANDLISHGPVPVGGSAPVAITALGDCVFMTIDGIPPRGVSPDTFGFSCGVTWDLDDAGVGKVWKMPIIGTGKPQVHIKGYAPQNEEDDLNAVAKALLKSGGYDVTARRDSEEIVLIVTRNPSTFPTRNVSDTHVSDVLAASARTRTADERRPLIRTHQV